MLVQVVIVIEPSCSPRERQDSHSTWINQRGQATWGGVIPKADAGIRPSRYEYRSQHSQRAAREILSCPDCLTPYGFIELLITRMWHLGTTISLGAAKFSNWAPRRALHVPQILSLIRSTGADARAPNALVSCRLAHCGITSSSVIWPRLPHRRHIPGAFERYFIVPQVLGVRVVRLSYLIENVLTRKHEVDRLRRRGLPKRSRSACRGEIDQSGVLRVRVPPASAVGDISSTK
jgi:hypothetical protein